MIPFQLGESRSVPAINWQIIDLQRAAFVDMELYLIQDPARGKNEALELSAMFMKEWFHTSSAMGVM
ncbi:unnamed protein product [Clonostachys chloroleuca]|uniref:Uncharacterized protein n=1 Tax=Clonostachys chloroleuca TaxID=1926264 RepID=A0AA35M915_9HYPO|nr:unnamed protein product [Clonostachys chloroleuca]